MVVEQRSVTGEVGEFIMECFLMAISKKQGSISETSVFSVLQPTGYGACSLDLHTVSRESDACFDVLSNCDFGTLCMNVDSMARFDFFCLMKHPLDGCVVAVFWRM